MSISCPQCGAALPDDAASCQSCGRDTSQSIRARGTVGVLSENVAGALAYFFLPAIVFLFVKPYSKNRFVRFHSLQCLGLCLAGVVAAAMLRLVGLAVFVIPVLGHLLVWLLSMVVVVAWIMLWIVLVVKALQGETFRLPVLGRLAERQAKGD